MVSKDGYLSKYEMFREEDVSLKFVKTGPLNQRRRWNERRRRNRW